MRDKGTIVSLFQDRKKHWGRVHAAGALIKQVYNGELELVLPDLETTTRAAVANLIMTGVDQHAMRIASVMPNIVCPPLKSGNAARNRADNRRMALQSWWYLNKIPRLQRRRARHLIGYSMSPVLVRPDKCGYPVWEMRDPLSTFPAPSDPDDLCPSDTIFCFKRTLRWLEIHYPEVAPRISRPANAHGDDMFEVIQYIDAEQITMIVLGQENERGDFNHVTLSTTSNLAGRPLVIVPGRITLDRLQGQFDQMIGMYEAQATLWALHIEAVKRGIFGELYAVAKDNGEFPEVEPADPYTGEIGRISGGTLQPVRADPGFQQLQAMDRLEASQRGTGAVPAEFGGEGASNVRTGRRGSQVLSSTVDYPIQEAQELLAASLQEENDAAMDIALAWWPNTSRTFAIPYAREPVTYTPAETFDTKAQFVQYSFAGSDTNGLVIEAGQRIGMGTLSKETFMAIDPLVQDPDAEMDRITLEGVRQASLSALQTQAADPAGPYQPADMARLEELIYDKNLPLFKAIAKLNDEKQKEQLAAQQGQLSDQAMQPGLGTAGAPGTPQAGQPIGAAPPSMGNLTNILANLRLQQRSSPAEAGSPTG